MRPYQHGANVVSFAKSIGCSKEEVIDFSSNINFVKPFVEIPKKLDFLYGYESGDYGELRAAIAAKYDLSPDGMELYNGASAAIFALFSFLAPKEVTLYAPIYLEYKKAANLQGAWITIVDRLKNYGEAKKNSLVVFVNPATPEGTLYDMPNLLDEWAEKECDIVVDESFLDFTNGASVIPYINKYEKLFVVKSMTKHCGSAGVRVGFTASSPKNIEALKQREPAWKLSSFDAYYMTEALNDDGFDDRSKEQNDANRALLREALEVCGLFCEIFEGKANFLCARLSEMSAHSLQERLAKHKILFRNCANFDTLDDSFVRFAVKEKEHIRTLKEALCTL